jgi:leucyl/phenylalanyl-tRNA---protein transferase
MGEATAEDIVAVGSDLSPATIIDCYRHGEFPMHTDGELVWWSPVRRGVLEPASFVASKSLHRARNHFLASFDAAFEDVIDGCGDPARRYGWINAEIRSAYIELHRLGYAHSVEIWDRDGGLAGGLYGLGVGGLFAAESKFFRTRDASKVALWHLSSALCDAGGRRLIDVQWLTPHLASLGCTEISRRSYLARLRGLVAEPELDWRRLAQNGRTTPARGG